MQGGLRQLGLVDPPARWIDGKLVEVFKDLEGSYVVKYTGGAGGGYLLIIGPPGEDFIRLDEAFGDAFARFKSTSWGTTDWEQPCRDYSSVLEEPEGRGLGIRIPLTTGEFEKSPLVCHTAQTDRWEADEDESASELPVWKWQQRIREAEQNRDWCLLDLDFRNSRRSLILLGSQPLREQRLSGGRRQPRAEGPLAHALATVLGYGGRCTSEDVLRHLDLIGAGRSYFVSRNKALTYIADITRLTAWRRVFKSLELSHINRGLYSLTLTPRSSKSRVYVFARHFEEISGKVRKLMGEANLSSSFLGKLASFAPTSPS